VERFHHIKKVINNDENLVKRFTRFFELETIKFDSFAKENVYYLDFPLWLAEMVDAGQLSAQQASILNKKEVLQKFNEETVKRLASLLEGKSVKDSERAIDQLLHFEPEVYNVWNFPNCNPLFGTDGYPGRIPGQIVQNVLYYYTNENDLVVDPMAGGGTIIDVCKLMNRRYLAYDIKPIEKDGITEHDIRNGFPDKTKGCDLIFLDPPYHNMVFDFFETVDDFYSFISKLAQNCYNTVKENGVVSLLMGNTNWKGDGFQDLSFQCYKLFIDAGFIPIMRIAVPFITEQFERFDVERAKKEKEMLGLVRDLIIFKKV